MGSVTRILGAIEQGDREAVDQLLPLVYEELKALAQYKMRHEKPGQTLQTTVLVHEVYLRLFEGEQTPRWKSRRHFFAAAAEAMRWILVDQARRKASQKHGGGLIRYDCDLDQIPDPNRDCDLPRLSDALEKLNKVDPLVAELVKMRYFIGFSLAEVADIQGISERTARNYWVYAKAWLLAELREIPG